MSERVPIAKRFWPKVKLSEGCWEWQASKTKWGYGKIGAGGGGNGFLLAHRVSWELTIGPIPQGTLVLHKCDNPPCVRPDHLFVGTHGDNVRDMFSKGRRAQDCDHKAYAKLDWGVVVDIREWAAAGATLACLARFYGISQGHVGQIVHGQIWQPKPAAWLGAEARARQAGLEVETSGVRLPIAESSLRGAIDDLLADVDQRIEQSQQAQAF